MEVFKAFENIGLPRKRITWEPVKESHLELHAWHNFKMCARLPHSTVVLIFRKPIAYRFFVSFYLYVSMLKEPISLKRSVYSLI